MKAFMRVKEASEHFSLGRDALYGAIKRREVKAYKPNGRDYLLKVADVERWVESKAV